jgi:hypothetical protein
MRTMDITPIPGTRSEYLSHTQRMFISQAISMRKVVDLGGADGSFALWMVQAGASEVMVVDKERYLRVCQHRRISYDTVYFKDAHHILNKKSYDVGVVSWPVNYWESMVTLVPVLIRLPMIIYIGNNTGVNQCGTPELWRYLTRRKLVFAEAGQPNTVLIYGEHGRVLADQPLQPEESFGLHPMSHEATHV